VLRLLLGSAVALGVAAALAVVVGRGSALPPGHGQDPVAGLNLLEYDAAANTAIVGWDPGSDAERYSYRARLDDGGWSDWTTTSDPQTDSDGLPAQPHQTLEVQVVAVDGDGNSSAFADWTGTIPTHSEVAGGSEEILPDDGSVPPTTGPPEHALPTSTPDVAVPVGVASEASYARFELDPASTGADVYLNGVGSTRPGTLGVTGLVIDAQTGEPVPDASLRLTSGSAVATTTSDAEGGYAFAEIPPSASEELTVSAGGYSPYEVGGMSYPVDDESVLTVRLSPTG
jgi:carboxypeptidase family protein